MTYTEYQQIKRDFEKAEKAYLNAWKEEPKNSRKLARLANKLNKLNAILENGKHH